QIVEAVIETIQTMLLIAWMEAGEECAPHIGFAVTVRIFRVENFGRRADDHALAPGEYAVRKTKALEKDCGLIILPVAIRIFEVEHRSTGLSFAIQPKWII